MRALGIAVKPGSDSTLPHLAIIVLEGSRAAYEIKHQLDFVGASDTYIGQIIHLSKELGSFLDGTNVDSIAIKTAGQSPVASRRKASTFRAHAEGAAIFTAREHSNGYLLVGDAAALSALAGTSKEAIESLASGMPTKWREASFAAIALLPAV